MLKTPPDCRLCGHVFCAACARAVRQLPLAADPSWVRVCDSCACASDLALTLESQPTHPSSLLSLAKVRKVEHRAVHIRLFSRLSHKHPSLGPKEMLYLSSYAAAKLGTDQAWGEIVLPLALKAIECLRIAPDHQDMDLRKHLRVLSLPGRGGTRYVRGVVLLKDVASKAMRWLLPLYSSRVVLVSFPLTYSGDDDNVADLSKVRREEQAHLYHLVHALLASRPNLIICGPSLASRWVVDQLERAGIVLLTGCTDSELDAISQCTGATITSTIDDLQSAPPGEVAFFDISEFTLHPCEGQGRALSLMKLQGKPDQTSIGSFLVSAPATPSQLVYIGDCARAVAQMAYNLRLERIWGQSLLSQPPETGKCDIQAIQALDRIIPLPHSLKPERLTQFVDGATSLSCRVPTPPPQPVQRLVTLSHQVTCVLKRLANLRSSNQSELPLAVAGSEQDLLVRALNPSYHGLQADERAAMVELGALRTCVLQQLSAWELFLSLGGDVPPSLPHEKVVWLRLVTSTIEGNTKVCSGPTLVTSTLYGDGDKSLGRAIVDLATLSCQSTVPCNGQGHTTTFFHGGRRADVRVYNRDTNFTDDSVQRWHACPVCCLSTDSAPLGDEGSMSFIQMLLLILYGSPLACTHTGFHCFAYHNVGCEISGSPVDTFDVVLPAIILVPRADLQHARRRNELEQLTTRATEWLDGIRARLDSLLAEAEKNTDAVARHRGAARGTELLTVLLKARESLFHEIRIKFLSPTTEMIALFPLWRRLGDEAERWTGIVAQYESEVIPRNEWWKRLSFANSPRKSVSHALSLLPSPSSNNDSGPSDTPSPVASSLELMCPPLPPSIVVTDAASSSHPQSSGHSLHTTTTGVQSTTPTRSERDFLATPHKTDPLISERIHIQRSALEARRSSATTNGHSCKRRRPAIRPGVVRSRRLPRAPARPHSYPHLRSRTSVRNRRRSNHGAVVVFCNVEEALSDSTWDETDYESESAESDLHVSHAPTHRLDDAKAISLPQSVVRATQTDLERRPAPPHSWEADVFEGEGEGDRSLFRTLADLWPSASDRLSPLERPMRGVHLFPHSHVPVHDKEPISVIALTLSSDQYAAQMKRLHPSVWDGSASLGTTLHTSTGTHMRFQFETPGSPPLIARVFYAEQFAALRQALGVEHGAFVASLARCQPWNAKGGKSNASFHRSLDHRFIIKTLSRTEFNAFTAFAPVYFAHFATCLGIDGPAHPSALARVLGLFRLELFEGPLHNPRKIDCIVMEDLFYGRRPTADTHLASTSGEVVTVFDLKGSLRNRFIPPGPASEGAVLLDANFAALAAPQARPLFLTEQSKRQLLAALSNDTRFLAQQGVMDYSLLVGVARSSCELVVGIVGVSLPHLGAPLCC